MGRTHGCARPLNAHQMAAVAILASIIATFFAAYPPLLASLTHEEDGTVCESTRTAVLTSFGALSLLVCFLGARTMMIDPSDPNVLAKTAGADPASLSGKFYCALCQLHVGRTSKHCRECDRCVHGFDHHCKWLNNCVGAANYAEFLWLLRMLVLLTLFHIVASCVALWRAVAHANHAESVSHDGLGSAELIALAAIMALVDMSALYLVGDLLSFHVVLMRVGLTTYEYIMRNRDEGRAAADAEEKDGLDAEARMSCLYALFLSSGRGRGFLGGRVVPIGSEKKANAASGRPARRVKLSACAALRSSSIQKKRPQQTKHQQGGDAGGGTVSALRGMQQANVALTIGVSEAKNNAVGEAVVGGGTGVQSHVNTIATNAAGGGDVRTIRSAIPSEGVSPTVPAPASLRTSVLAPTGQVATGMMGGLASVQADALSVLGSIGEDVERSLRMPDGGFTLHTAAAAAGVAAASGGGDVVGTDIGAHNRATTPSQRNLESEQRQHGQRTSLSSAASTTGRLPLTAPGTPQVSLERSGPTARTSPPSENAQPAPGGDTSVGIIAAGVNMLPLLPAASAPTSMLSPIAPMRAPATLVSTHDTGTWRASDKLYRFEDRKRAHALPEDRT